MFNGYNHPAYESDSGRDSSLKNSGHASTWPYSQPYYNHSELQQTSTAPSWQPKLAYPNVSGKCGCAQCQQGPWYHKEGEPVMPNAVNQDMMLLGHGIGGGSSGDYAMDTYPRPDAFMRNNAQVAKNFSSCSYPALNHQVYPPRLPTVKTSEFPKYDRTSDQYMRMFDTPAYGRKAPDSRQKYWDGANGAFYPSQQYQYPPQCRYPPYNAFYLQNSNQTQPYQPPQHVTQQNGIQPYYGIVPNPMRPMEVAQSMSHNYLKQDPNSKISPLRLMRKKKLAEGIDSQPSPPKIAQVTENAPPLDVRRFLATWADEDEDSPPIPQLVVVDCQDINSDQAELLRLYESSTAVRLISEPPSMEQEAIQSNEIEEVSRSEPVAVLNDVAPGCMVVEPQAPQQEDGRKSVESQHQHVEQNESPVPAPAPAPSPASATSATSHDSLPVLADLPTSEYRKNKFLDYDQQSFPLLPIRSTVNETMAVNPCRPEPIATIDDVAEKKSTSSRKRNRKPTIKFSIQKSHDLKISLRVMNESQSDLEQINKIERVGVNGEDDSGDLFTLRLDGESDAELQDVRAKRGKKLKRRRLVEETYSVSSEDHFNDVTADGFQVEESVDSAKIKLTFKRRKGEQDEVLKRLDGVPRKKKKAKRVRGEKDDHRVKGKCRGWEVASPDSQPCADTTTDLNGQPPETHQEVTPSNFENLPAVPLLATSYAFPTPISSHPISEPDSSHQISISQHSDTSSPKISSSCHITSPRTSTDSIERELQAIWNDDGKSNKLSEHQIMSNDENVVDFYTEDISTAPLEDEVSKHSQHFRENIVESLLPPSILSNSVDGSDGQAIDNQVGVICSNLKINNDQQLNKEPTLNCSSTASSTDCLALSLLQGKEITEDSFSTCKTSKSGLILEERSGEEANVCELSGKKCRVPLTEEIEEDIIVSYSPINPDCNERFMTEKKNSIISGNIVETISESNGLRQKNHFEICEVNPIVPSVTVGTVSSRENLSGGWASEGVKDLKINELVEAIKSCEGPLSPEPLQLREHCYEPERNTSQSPLIPAISCISNIEKDEIENRSYDNIVAPTPESEDQEVKESFLDGGLRVGPRTPEGSPSCTNSSLSSAQSNSPCRYTRPHFCDEELIAKYLKKVDCMNEDAGTPPPIANLENYGQVFNSSLSSNTDPKKDTDVQNESHFDSFILKLGKEDNPSMTFSTCEANEEVSTKPESVGKYFGDAKSIHSKDLEQQTQPVGDNLFRDEFPISFVEEVNEPISHLNCHDLKSKIDEINSLNEQKKLEEEFHCCETVPFGKADSDKSVLTSKDERLETSTKLSNKKECSLTDPEVLNVMSEQNSLADALQKEKNNESEITKELNDSAALKARTETEETHCPTVVVDLESLKENNVLQPLCASAVVIEPKGKMNENILLIASDSKSIIKDDVIQYSGSSATESGFQEIACYSEMASKESESARRHSLEMKISNAPDSITADKQIEGLECNLISGNLAVINREKINIEIANIGDHGEIENDPLNSINQRRKSKLEVDSAIYDNVTDSACASQDGSISSIVGSAVSSNKRNYCEEQEERLDDAVSFEEEKTSVGSPSLQSLKHQQLHISSIDYGQNVNNSASCEADETSFIGSDPITSSGDEDNVPRNITKSFELFNCISPLSSPLRDTKETTRQAEGDDKAEEEEEFSESNNDGNMIDDSIELEADENANIVIADENLVFEQSEGLIENLEDNQLNSAPSPVTLNLSPLNDESFSKCELEDSVIDENEYIVVDGDDTIVEDGVLFEISYGADTIENKIEAICDMDVENIPLPPGEAPPENCFDFHKWSESKNKSCSRLREACDSPFPSDGLCLFRNPSPPGTPRMIASPEDDFEEKLSNSITTVLDHESPAITEVEGDILPDDLKFQHVMENCLANASKFLCEAEERRIEMTSEKDVEKSEPEGLSRRDVLLSSFEVHSDSDIPYEASSSVEVPFSPFHTVIASETLPVDNWPYLEEEVPMSPQWPSVINDDIPLLDMECNSEKCPEINIISSPLLPNFVSEDQANVRDTKLDNYADQIVNKTKCIPRIRRRTLDNTPIRGRRKKFLSERERGDSDSEHLLQDFKCQVSLERLAPRFGEKEKSELAGWSRKKFIDSLSNDNMDNHEHEGEDFKGTKWQPKVILRRISKMFSKISSKNKCNEDSVGSKKSQEATNSFEPPIKTRKEDKIKKPLKIKCSESKLSKKSRFLRSVNGCEINKSNLSQIKSKINILNKTKEITSSSSTCETSPEKTLHFKNVELQRNSKGKSKCSEEENCEYLKKPVQKGTNIESPPYQNKDIKSSHLLSIGNTTKISMDTKASDTSKLNWEVPNGEVPRNILSSEKEKRDSSIKHKSVFQTEKSSQTSKDDQLNRAKHSSGKRYNIQSKIVKRTASCGILEGKRNILNKAEKKVFDDNFTREVSGSTDRKNADVAWVCAVCGFDDVLQRKKHIQEHAFHCQGCHLAFASKSPFIQHLSKKHEGIQKMHHCLLCELSFDTFDLYNEHLRSREHTHLEQVEKSTIHTLFTLLCGESCPALGPITEKPEWLPNQAGTVHFYHQATPLSLAIQYWKQKHSSVTKME